MNSLCKLKKIFILFLASYLAIFLISFLGSLWSVGKMLSIIEDKVHSSNLIALEQCRDNVDMRLKELRREALQISALASKSSLNNTLSPYQNTENVVSIMDFSKSLSEGNYIDDLVIDVYVYFLSPQIILTPTTIFLSLEDFYGYFFTYENWSLEDFKEQLLVKNYTGIFRPAAEIVRAGEQSEFITYVLSFPYISMKGNILMIISTNRIKDYIEDVYRQKEGWFCILDEHGEEVFSSDNFTLSRDNRKLIDQKTGLIITEINNQKMIISQTQSSCTDWSYIVAVPYRTVMAEVNSLRMSIFIIQGFILLMGILGAVLLANWRTTPIRHLSKILNDKLELEENEYILNANIIENKLSDIITNRKELRDQLKNQSVLLRATLVDQMLYDSLPENIPSEVLAQKLGMPVLNQKFSVVICKIHKIEIDENGLTDDPEILNMFNYLSLVADNGFNLIFLGEYYRKSMDFSQICFLVGGIDDASQLAGRLKRIGEFIENKKTDKCMLSCSFYAGPIVDTYYDIHFSYQKAIGMTHYKYMSQPEIIIYDHNRVGLSTTAFYYPIELEQQIKNAVLQGNQAVVEKKIQQVYEENFIKSWLTSANMTYLFINLKCTLIKIFSTLAGDDYSWINEIENQINLLNPENSADYEKSFFMIQDLYLKLCALVERERSADKARDHVKHICRYLKENSSNGEINMYFVSEKFSLNVSYLSRIFKKYTGSTFSDYLRKLRIHEACDSLRKGKKSISDIAVESGYNSVDAFRKAFKIEKSISPQEYKFIEKS